MKRNKIPKKGKKQFIREEDQPRANPKKQAPKQKYRHHKYWIEDDDVFLEYKKKMEEEE